MLHKFQLKQLLLIFAFLAVSLACQDDPFLNEESDLIDKDMVAAEALVSRYLSKTGASTGSNATTVLKMVDGVLMFDTNTDNISYYQPVNEETVTAIVSPGESVFWYGGESIDDLEGIEYDGPSQQIVGEDPDEAELDLLWVSTMPSVIDSTTVLKYDILYQVDENSPVIRLDPKIEISGDDN